MTVFAYIIIQSLLINLIFMLESRLSQQSLQSNHLPQKEEWAIIYNHRAMQLQKAKSLQKMISLQKKDSFKKQLDQQIVSKNNVGQHEKQQDRRYYEYIVQKDQQLKQKEQKQKFEKFIRYKQLEEQNQKTYQRAKSPKVKENKVYNLEIGLKSEIEKKQRAQSIRKDVIQTLDQQRQHKQQQRKKNRQSQIELFYKNQAYEDEKYNNRTRQVKKYEQNQAVYNYYRDLYNQKRRKDKQLQHKLVDEVQQRKEEQEIKKKQSDFLNKQRKNLQMKDTLQKQLQLLNYRRNQQKNSNPEQITYGFINNIFRQKKAPFDKKQYSQFLDRQAEEQRMNKQQQRYMSEEQYKYNSNQLNRALSGNYTFDKYQDRSINTLGDKLNVAKVEPWQGQDADLIKTKLQTLRSRNRSTMHSRGDMDNSFT